VAVFRFRLSNCEAAADMLQKYQKNMEAQKSWVSQMELEVKEANDLEKSLVGCRLPRCRLPLSLYPPTQRVFSTVKKEKRKKQTKEVENSFQLSRKKKKAAVGPLSTYRNARHFLTH
jgi:hypothetical protein